MSIEHLIVLLCVALIVFLALYRFVKDRLDFYQSLGAEVKGFRWLIHPRAEFVVDGLSVELYTSGLRGMQRLELGFSVGIRGCISLRRGDFLDRLLLHKT
ncbi:MAG: FeoB-associated Cys-rich membrane protein, partial [Aquificaceae bacterium]|nr:FeoB-associated Cys-rich membrane protein [Aquificaceae bacterium]